ncbi:hypothetical protein Cni_G05981 [Canna indica]|uniref:Uncharacterized protein n=1 Tax=Canna indica TaxID=4628 RepID=A0AAQ3JXP9_9LILI|nr:hypothetical protein Cni_G05981 [Canna indica]
MNVDDKELEDGSKMRWDYLSKVVGLDANSLSGSIPSEIEDLANLNSLNLSSNLLSGPIPPEIGRLTNLSYLGLSSNLLSGSIPPEIGDLANLNHLRLSFNSLSGSIPPKMDWRRRGTHSSLSKLASSTISPACHRGMPKSTAAYGSTWYATTKVATLWSSTSQMLT